MKKKNIRIFTLAKELGLDSNELISYANRAGVDVKKSALASITPEERDVVVRFIEADRQAGEGAEGAESRVPARDRLPEDSGKVRSIRQIAPQTPPSPRSRTTAAESGRPDSVDSQRSAARETVAEVGTATIGDEAPDLDSDPAADTDAELESDVHTATATATEEVETESSAVDEHASETDESATDTEGVDRARTVKDDATARTVEEDEAETAESSKTEADAPTTDEQGAISRDDYIPASGTPRRSIVDMEMKPRGTISGTPEAEEETARSERPRQEKRTSRPQFAEIPKFTGPQPETKKPKKKEDEAAKAQKPDVRLTPNILNQQSPLSDQMRQRIERKEKERKRGKSRLKDVDLIAAAQAEEQRLREGKKRRSRGGQRDSGTAAPPRARAPQRRRKKRTGPVVYQTEAVVELPITIRSLSEAMGRPARDLINILFKRGEMVQINDNVSEETALELAVELGVDLTIKRDRDFDEELQSILSDEDPDESLNPRPPIVTILGHVDHGKTSLLDKLRSADVAGGEAGGITQHIASYQVEHNGQRVTFVDTPGHAAFGEMRARGANVTDIVVLVVAADDGVMPQTIECISHARSAGVPIVVAMNKIDRPEVNEQKVLQDLAGQEVLPAEWGGDTEVVRTSAITGQGLDDLLETILLTAELHEFRANPDRPAVGVCLEAFRDEGRGTLAWLIVQKGTLHVGDVVICGEGFGRIRAIYNDRDEEIEQAPPSTPVRVAGLDAVPQAGDHFFVMEDIEEAREFAQDRRERDRTEMLSHRGRPRTLDDILAEARGGTVQDLPLIIKADSPGSLEALRGEIGKIEHAEVRVEIVHQGVGGVNESDVTLAQASGAIIIAFHVIPEDRALHLADRSGVEIRRYNIIYEVTDHIKRSLEGLLEPELVEVPTGRALVLQTFDISRMGRIAGCRVLSGTIERNNRVHVFRDQKILNDYNIASLKREKDDAKEVREGMECGIRLDGFNDVKEGDLLEAYRIDRKKRTLE